MTETVSAESANFFCHAGRGCSCREDCISGEVSSFSETTHHMSGIRHHMSSSRHHMSSIRFCMSSIHNKMSSIVHSLGQCMLWSILGNAGMPAPHPHPSVRDSKSRCDIFPRCVLPQINNTLLVRGIEGSYWNHLLAVSCRGRKRHAGSTTPDPFHPKAWKWITRCKL